MKPKNLKTYIFLDSGDPQETKKTIEMLGFLDGQTTNPSLISKNPQTKERIASGVKFTKKEIYELYKEIVGEISYLIPNGSVSIEVYADKNTTSEEMMSQARIMNAWISNAHIKFPTTAAGLSAAHIATVDGMRVNMTLCFTQEQAAAVYAATKSISQQTLLGYKNVFISPFVGRIDDIGQNGMDLVKNIVHMYASSDGHVATLAASVRSLDHFLYSLSLGSDIITAPYAVLEAWKNAECPIPDSSYSFDPKGLRSILYKQLDLNTEWNSFDIDHPLVNSGVDTFAADWNKLIQQ